MVKVGRRIGRDVYRSVLIESARQVVVAAKCDSVGGFVGASGRG